MGSLEVELDTYGLERAMESLENAVENLEDKTAQQVQAIKELVLALTSEKEAHSWSKAEGKKTYCGFTPGDEVVFIGPLQPHGVRGVVDPDAWDSSNYSGIIPVSRKDTGEGDGFPARNTILASSFACFVAPQEETPSGDTLAWNLNTLQRAIDEKRNVEFSYVKPATDPLWLPSKTIRRVSPLKLERAGESGSLSKVIGRDLNVDALRSFRVDRIEGYVTLH